MKKNAPSPLSMNDLQEVLKDYPTKDYLEERLDLFGKGVDEAVKATLDQRFTVFEEKLNKKIDEAFERFQNKLFNTMGLTIADHEQRIIRLEESVNLTR